ncbi:MAG TPA: hypothetical protein VHX19_03775 [Stellaceae bacterium]|jgi:hypothetical protein|nr:hypothetical protein [Stellaceae bacterium]
MAHALRFNLSRRLLLVEFSEAVTDTGFRAAYDDAASLIKSNGPCSVIVDFSPVKQFDLSPQFARQLGLIRPALPVGMRCIVVSPQPEIYGTARIVSAWGESSGSSGELILLKSFAEAFVMFGVDASDFANVERA